MHIEKVGIDNQNNVNFNGRAVVRGVSRKAGKDIAYQLNALNALRNSEANVYVDASWCGGVRVAAVKGRYDSRKAGKTQVETVLHPDALVSATKRSLAKFNASANDVGTPVTAKRVVKESYKDVSGEPYYPYETKMQKIVSGVKKFFGIE